MGKIKKLVADFKAFISRGNVVDMAVAVIIGAAFSAIVTSLTNEILKPLINYAVGGDGDGIGLVTMLKEVRLADGSIDSVNSIYIDWGSFIMKIVDFLLVALILFVVIKIFVGLKSASLKAAERAKAERNKMIEKLTKKGMSQEEAEAQAAVEVVEEQAAAPIPTTEELLIQIRDLLAAQNAASVAAPVEEPAQKSE